VSEWIWGFASGVLAVLYFARMSAGSRRETKRFVHLP
jgi:hypothetical protein